MRDSEIIFTVQEAADGGYSAQALGNPVFTEAESVKELREIVRDAVRCYFEADQLPAVIRLHFECTLPPLIVQPLIARC
jgi:hypothetical protein